MKEKTEFESKEKLTLYKQLKKLDNAQFKIFYGAFVYYLVNYNFFISKQNLFNLRCEQNLLCHELDESFPDQYDDHQLMKSFFLAHPYYYMDKLPIELMARLFAQYVDNRIDILANMTKILYEADIYAAYTYADKALGLNEDIDTLVAQIQDHIKSFSYHRQGYQDIGLIQEETATQKQSLLSLSRSRTQLFNF